jgi:hypothetical protein
MFMRLALRLYVVLALVLTILACNRQAQETTPATPSQPAAQAPNTSSPAAEPGKSDSAPRAQETSPAEPATPKAAAPKSATSKAPASQAEAPKSPAAPPPEVVEIPAGTTLTVAMIDAVGTDTSKAGDTFMASVAEPVVVNGKTVLPKGMKVRGRVATVDEPGRVKGKAAISLVLTQFVKNGKTYAITTEPFTAQAAAGTKKDALKVGAGAAIGAAIGAIAGGGKGAAIGAAAGGGAGTAAVLATKGDHIKIDSETKVNFVLKNDVKVETNKSPT